VSQVNLLPPELRQRQATRRTTSMAILAGVAALGVVILFSFMKSTELSSKQEALAQQQQVNQRVQTQIGELKKFGDLKTELQTKQQLLSTVYANEVSWSGILLDVARVIPPDAYLTNFTGSTAPTGTTASTPDQTGLVGSLAFSGNVKGADTLAAWLTRLEQVHGWVNAWSNSASESGPFSRVYTFQSGVDLSKDVVTKRGRAASQGATP
jgi:Tfp pilus assembly protein PilN